MDGWFDGGSRGNPGIAGSGWVLKNKDNTIINAGCVYVGSHATNNEAEYMGLIALLEAAVANNAVQLMIYGDSLLVINQMLGLWQVKDLKMRQMHARATRTAQQIPSVAYEHVLRHLNKEADLLSNIAMDSQQSQLGPHLLLQVKPATIVPTYTGPTCAVRIKRERGRIVQDCDVWVGGAWTKGGWLLPRSEWCNSFAAHKTKEAALSAYKDFILSKPEMLNRIKTELKGRRLGCFCDPADPHCHAVWLAEMAEKYLE